MRNIKLTIEYNGAQFSGWQKQIERRTVQGEIENAIFSLTGERVSVEGSGRTDKGVHALAQVASFSMENIMPIENLKTALNNLLPKDIEILKTEEVDSSFHARFSAKKKTYIYNVQVGGEYSAINCDLLAFYQYDVDFDVMKKAAKLLIGKHNFKGFCSADTSATNFEREIFDIIVSKKDGFYSFEVTGSGFLYNMVRIIVGTLLDVGSGRIGIENVELALEKGERKYSGKTMPPEGLYLKEVVY